MKNELPDNFIFYDEYTERVLVDKIQDLVKNQATRIIKKNGYYLKSVIYNPIIKEFEVTWYKEYSKRIY